MELLHSTALCVARFHRCTGSGGSDFRFFQQRQRSQVRRFPWFAANAAAPSRPAPVKPDFFDDDDSEDEEEDRSKAGELEWATKAREMAIQDMSFRNFTDEDFQALLPPHLRIQKKSKKKKKNTRAKQAAEAALQLEESRSAITKKTKKKKDKDDDVSSNLRVVDDTPVDPKKLRALAKRFNAHRERYMNIEQSYSDSEGDEDKEELRTELTVVYGERREQRSGGEESDDGEDLPAPLKDPRLLEIRLNQDLVDSRDVEEVLETIDRVKGRFRLSSINVATALHRIAKHMVTLSMSETRRLKYARQCDVCELVASAMELLPECNAQGVSNIAWAISKIGGHLLYRGEMEIIARAALAKVDEFNPQNLANVAGAFASMQHSSPALFEKLMDAASRVPREFRAQELAQLLWSFACMAQPLDSFLDSLDAALEQEQGSSQLGEEQVPGNQEEEVFPGKLSIEQLSSIAWSYAVLGQLQRPFFAHVCKEIRAFEQDASVGQHKHMLQLTQLHQVALALKWEGKNLELGLGDRIEKLAASAWEKERSSRKSTSFLQKDIERFLVCTGRQWIPEYVDADYSLDFAMKDGKVAIEVNGPSHFVRNTGELLGHTVLKHRLLEAAGWKIISASYAEWENLQGESEHVDFIQKLVAPHIMVKQSMQANEQ